MDNEYNPVDRPQLNGERVVLRSPQPSDKANRLSYGRHLEFRKMVGGDPKFVSPLTAEEVDRWFAEVTADPLCWIVDLDGRCIGTVQLHSLEVSNRRARYAIGLFDPATWNRGIGTEATRLVLHYAFAVLRLHRVDLRVLTFNTRAIACYRKCGFVQEGIERDSTLIAGEWQSDVIMSILEQEYFALTHEQ